MGRRVDTDGDRDEPGEDQRRDGQDEREAHTVPNETRDRRVPLERQSEVSMRQDALHPFVILDVARLVEAVRFLERRQLLVGDVLTLLRELCGVVVEETTRR